MVLELLIYFRGKTLLKFEVTLLPNMMKYIIFLKYYNKVGIPFYVTFVLSYTDLVLISFFPE